MCGKPAVNINVYGNFKNSCLLCNYSSNQDGVKVVVEHLGELEEGAVVQIVPHEESQNLCFDHDHGGWGV